MTGTKEGAIIGMQKNLAKDPNYFSIIGAKGGSVKSPKKGFGGMSKERQSAYSRKGGTKSRRKPKYQ